MDEQNKQPCGHDTSCIVSSTEGTNYCSACEEEAKHEPEVVIDPSKPHAFIFSSQVVGRCGICQKRQSHIIHRRPKMRYAPGTPVGRYVADKNGCLRRASAT